MGDFGKLNFSVSFNRTSAFPLEANSYFTNLEQAEAAAKTAVEPGSADSTYYIGLTLTVADETDCNLYIIKPDLSLKRLTILDTSDVAWESILNKPTTIGGYGITDAYTKTESDNRYIRDISSGIIDGNTYRVYNTDNESGIGVKRSAGFKAFFGAYNTSVYLCNSANAGGDYLKLNDDHTLTYRDYTVWHAGNDGSDSGLDADTIDGYHRLDLVRTYNNTAVYGTQFATGGIDNAWKKIFSINVPTTGLYKGCTVKGIIYYAPGNHAQVYCYETPFEVVFNLDGDSYTGHSVGLYLKKYFTIDIIRVVRVTNYSYEIQVRQQGAYQDGYIYYQYWNYGCSCVGYNSTSNASEGTVMQSVSSSREMPEDVVYKAIKLQTSRTINGTNFDGTANITTAKWGTTRTFYIKDADETNASAGVSVDGSGNVSLKLPSWIKASLSGNASSASKLQDRVNDSSVITLYSGKRSDGTFTRTLVDNGAYLLYNGATLANVNSNVASATKLQTPRTIWGQSFDGTNDVNGVFTATSTYNSNYNHMISLYNTGLTNGNIVNIQIGHSASPKNLGYLGFGYYGSGNNANYLTLGLHSVDKILNITGAGNVGIGTTSPLNKLDVYGNFSSRSGNGGYIIYPGYKSDESFRLECLNSSGAWIHNGMVMLQNGNVGIGTVTPSDKLHVAGNILATGEIYANTSNKVWHSGNDGSGSGLDADLLDGTHITDIFRYLGHNIDLNSFADYSDKTGIISLNTSTPSTINSPISYGGALQFNTKELNAQFVLNNNSNIIKYRTRWWSNNGGSWSNWRQLAFIDSNVESATKLQTPRSLWGLSFDGQQNISGNMTGVGVIIANGESHFSNGTYSDPASNIICAMKISQNFAAGSNCYLATLNGNVGIGTTAPGEKLTVAGNISATGALIVMSGSIMLKYTPYPNNQNVLSFDWGTYSSDSLLFQIPGNHQSDRRMYLTDGKGLTLNFGAVYAPSGFYEESDINLKTNIKSIDFTNNIELVSFNWKESGKKSYGVIAQLVELYYPELVSTDESTGYKSVNYDAVLIIKCALLENRIKQLEKELEDLKYGKDCN